LVFSAPQLRKDPGRTTDGGAERGGWRSGAGLGDRTEGLRPGAGQSWSGVSPGCTRHGGLRTEGSGKASVTAEAQRAQRKALLDRINRIDGKGYGLRN